jgi:hypothetical protein
MYVNHVLAMNFEASLNEGKRMQLKKIVVLGLSVTMVFSAGVVVGAQPHMQNALGSLQGAKSQLQQASNNKGSHRVRAIELVDQAISEVQAGINYAAGR